MLDAGAFKNKGVFGDSTSVHGNLPVILKMYF
jgi:hypothetical protein